MPELDTTLLNKNEQPPASATSQVTTVTTKEESIGVGSVSKDSRIFGVSIMAWALLIMIMTLAGCQLLGLGVYDCTKDITLIIISFYAGKQMNK